MRINSSISPGPAAASLEQASKGSALERQIAFLQKQVQALKDNKQSRPDSAEAIKELERQISELQQQLNLEKLQENKQKLEEAQRNIAEQAEREAAKRQEPDEAVISQQARDLFSAMSGKEELSTLRRTQSLLPTQEERDSFASKITSKALEIQKELVRNTEKQAELARTLLNRSSANELQDPVLLAEELRIINLELEEASSALYPVYTTESMLEETLGGQPGEVMKAAYAIINTLFDPPDLSAFSWEEINTMRRAGMAQAQYIADNYISDEKHKKLFMGSMFQLSAKATLMKREDHIAEVVAAARQRNAGIMKVQQTDGDQMDTKNPFENADTSSLSSFIADMSSRFNQLGPNVSSYLNESLQAFARIFELSSSKQ